MVTPKPGLTRFTQSLTPPHFNSRIRRPLSTFRPRSIVSSYICTPPTPTQPLKFALFKRSEKKSLYPGKWAICSGTIETTDTSPAAAARREILEETGLDDEDYELFRKGESYKLLDEGIGMEWTVYAFAWMLKEGAEGKIRLDREHTEVRFIRPEDLGSYDHVEKLEVGLEKVIGEWRRAADGC